MHFSACFVIAKSSLSSCIHVILNRKTLAVATSVLVAGGTAAYVHWRLQNRFIQPDSFNHDIIPVNNKEKSRTRKKKAGLRSLQVLAAILLSQMGRKGARNLLAIVATVVSFIISISQMCCYNIHIFFYCLAGSDKWNTITTILYFLNAWDDDDEVKSLVLSVQYGSLAHDHN